MSQRKDSSGIPWLRAASCSSSRETPSSGLATRAGGLMLSGSIVTVDPFDPLQASDFASEAQTIRTHTVTPRRRPERRLNPAQQRLALAPEGHQIRSRCEIAGVPQRAEGHVPERSAIMIAGAHVRVRSRVEVVSWRRPVRAIVQQDRHVEMLGPQDRLLIGIEHPQRGIAEHVPAKYELRRCRVKINNVIRLRPTATSVDRRRSELDTEPIGKIAQ